MKSLKSEEKNHLPVNQSVGADGNRPQYSELECSI